MPLLIPDPTFYPSPTMALQSPPEKLAYLALINPLKEGRPDAMPGRDIRSRPGANSRIKD